MPDTLYSSNNGQKTQSPRDGWSKNCSELIEWVKNNLLVRTDCYGFYAPKPFKKDEPLTDDIIASHFRGNYSIGAYTTCPKTNKAKWFGFDIDAHNDNADPNANLNQALRIYNALRELGFHPILEDSNGKGGYHIWVTLIYPTDCETVFRFANWLVRDEEDKPEVFPKQIRIREDGHGNFMRLPGKHHTRNHFSKIYDGEKFVSGSNAVGVILTNNKSDPLNIPNEALTFEAGPQRPEDKEWQGGLAEGDEDHLYEGNLWTLNILKLCEDRLTGKKSGEAYEITCLNSEEHTTGGEVAYIWEATEKNRPSYCCNHSHCSHLTIWDLYRHYGCNRVNECCAEEKSQSVLDDILLRKMESKLDELGFDELCFDEETNEEPSEPCFDENVGGEWVAPENKKASGYVFGPMSFGDLQRTTFHLAWLIDGMLVKGQPCILGGPKKSLKTNLLVAMSIALGSGGKFLGRWQAKKARTLFISGESGGATIKETAIRIARAAHVDLDEVDAYFDERLPKLSVEEEMETLTAGIKEMGIEVIIIDPLYLCLLQGGEKQASNLYDMGPLLLQIADACLGAGATPILAHHSRKNLNNPTSPLELEDLAFSGISEFARQWLLVNRRAAYNPSQPHKLWFGYGGSVGHGGLFGLEIDEGELQSDFSGRIWDVSVKNLDEIKAEKADAKLTKKGEEMNDKKKALLAVVGSGKYSKTGIRRELGWGAEKFNPVYSWLEKDEYLKVEKMEVEDASGRPQPKDVVLLTDKEYVGDWRPDQDYQPQSCVG